MDGTTTVGCWIIYLFARVFLAFFVIGINLQFPSRLTLLLSFSGLTSLWYLWYLWTNISDHVAQSRIYNHIHWIMTLFYRTGCERLTHVTHVTSDSHSQSLKKKLWLHPLARESTPFDQWSASRFESLSRTIIFVGCTLLLSNLIDRSPLSGDNADFYRSLLMAFGELLTLHVGTWWLFENRHANFCWNFMRAAEVVGIT